MRDFKSIQLRPMVGMLDTLSAPDDIGWGNWRLVKNVVARASKNRQRAGGWRRLFADDEVYNNQDLHDQLTDQLFYYDLHTAVARGGGVFDRYSSAYFWPTETSPLVNVFPPADGPICNAYIGDFPSGLYEGCPIFYPSIGLPYEYVPGYVSTTGLTAHWRFDGPVGVGWVPDEVGSADLAALGGTIVSGVVGSAREMVIDNGDYIFSTDFTLKGGNILFGYTGWIRPYDASALSFILGIWGTAGGREYRLYISGGFLVFEVSADGTASVTVTHTHAVVSNEWMFFACWHDPVTDTIKIKVNDETTISAVADPTGVFALSASQFYAAAEPTTIQPAFDGRLDSWSFWKNGFPSEVELSSLYANGFGSDYPFDRTAICNTGYPFYYLYSSLYTSCPVVYGGEIIPGYPYGPQTPIYSSPFSYEYSYCGDELQRRTGCREAVTLLGDIITENGRKLIAGTMSRIYEYNQSAGNWSVLAAGLGNSGYTAEQCGCNSVRTMMATMGGWAAFTNGIDEPLLYFVGDPQQECTQQSAQSIPDLVALDITRAGGVVSWKGFMFFFDITESAERKPGTIIWSDLEQPDSFIEGDNSFAARSTIAVGETILNAAPLGNWLIFYTDKSIIRCTLVGGEDVFNFERIYGTDKNDSGAALKYKFSLIDTGEMHIFAGESDVYMMTAYDNRPMAVPWISRAAGFMFHGIHEDDADYEAVNEEACDLVTGGWNSETREAFLSWPTGSNICPNVTLRLNIKYNVADIIDHGFTAFKSFTPDDRPTVGRWMSDLGICEAGEFIAGRLIDGPMCFPIAAVDNPPTSIRNATEDPNLPPAPDSLCAALGDRTMDDFCRSCPSNLTFIAASAEDFSLKQLEDDMYFREMLMPEFEPGGVYDAYSCTGDYYEQVAYDSVMQIGAETFKMDDEKMIRRIQLEAHPLEQSTPSMVECDVGYASQPSCFTWVELPAVEYECTTEYSAAQHAANNTRPDGRFSFNCWRRGVYLSARFRIGGFGGGGKFGAMWFEVKPWGQSDH